MRPAGPLCRRPKLPDPDSTGAAESPARFTLAHPQDLLYNTSMYCYAHSKVTTSVACGRCGRPICSQCMVSGPAGMRCSDCGSFKSAAAATQDNPGRLGAALVAAIVAALAGAYVMVYIVSWLGFLIALAGPVYGRLVAEVVQRAAGRQKPILLQGIGVGAALLGLLIAFVLSYGGAHPLPVTLPQITWPMFGVAITLTVSTCIKRLGRQS